MVFCIAVEFASPRRLKLPVVKGNPNADPSSVCFHAHQKAIADKTQFLICDTAGRIHTRHNLMEELGYAPTNKYLPPRPRQQTQGCTGAPARLEPAQPAAGGASIAAT